MHNVQRGQPMHNVQRVQPMHNVQRVQPMHNTYFIFVILAKNLCYFKVTESLNILEW